MNNIRIEVRDRVGIVQMQRPPHNYFDIDLIAEIADAWEDFERTPAVRAIVLAAEGKSFCAGADFSKKEVIGKKRSARSTNPLYLEALRLFACTKPVVAAVHGAAVGGGLGLALTADFRVSCAEAKFSANFNRLGFHPGFALSHTLPALVGEQRAAMLFYTGRRIDGKEALDIGLVDQLVDQAQVLDAAFALAREVAISSPRALQSTRETLRLGRLDAIRAAVARESAAQAAQMHSADIHEGVLAMKERRQPDFADQLPA